MVPARTTSPVFRLTPSRLDLLSRPLRELPPPFLCAIGCLLAWTCGALRRLGGRRARRSYRFLLFLFGRLRLGGGRLRPRPRSRCFWCRRTLFTLHVGDQQLSQLAAISQGAAATLLRLVGENAQLAAAAVRDDGRRDSCIAESCGAGFRAGGVRKQEDRLERSRRGELGGGGVDEEPVAGADAVLVTAVLEDCVHRSRAAWPAI